MIRVSGVCRYFGERSALEDVSLTVEKGEISALLGPNGAGKTTLMNILSGADDPDRGRVEIGGQSMSVDRSLCQKKIGYAPENSPLYGHLTVREYLEYMAGIKGLGGDIRTGEIDRVSKLFDLGEVHPRRTENLSRGYRQRVSLAQAFLGDPPILLLDEPTTGLDPGQMKEVRDIILSVKKEKTILLSTHILQEASLLCSRIFILSRGEILSSGFPAELSMELGALRRWKIVLKSPCNPDKLKEAGGDDFLIDVETGGTVLLISVVKETLSEEDILVLLKRNGLSFRSFEPAEPDLEEIFLKLTGKA